MSREDGDKFSAQKYVQSHGPDLYRRTMYTFWKRTCPPPTLATFDAPDRELCTVRRARTNTPLQALVLLNDPTYVEASRKLAERILALARQHGVPIRHDPDLVGLLAVLDVGSQIPPELYQAVAEVLAFVYHLNSSQRPAR